MSGARMRIQPIDKNTRYAPMDVGYMDELHDVVPDSLGLLQTGSESQNSHITQCAGRAVLGAVRSHRLKRDTASIPVKAPDSCALRASKPHGRAP
jgi:hypothetical protein